MNRAKRVTEVRNRYLVARAACIEHMAIQPAILTEEWCATLFRLRAVRRRRFVELVCYLNESQESILTLGGQV